MAFISYTERPISALGSAWEAGTRLIWSKPFIIGPEYSPIQWTAFWNRAHQKHAHPTVQLTSLTSVKLHRSIDFKAQKAGDVVFKDQKGTSGKKLRGIYTLRAHIWIWQVKLFGEPQIYPDLKIQFPGC